MKKLLSFCIAAALGGIPSVLNAEDAAVVLESGGDFARLKASFESELQKVSDVDSMSIADAQKKHIAAMKDLQKKVQLAGKLEPMLAIKKEVERFSQEKSIKPDAVSADIPELQALQKSYLQEVEKLKFVKADKIMALVPKYDQSLKALQETLTKKGQIEAAIEVKKERDSVKDHPVITAARGAQDERQAREKAVAAAIPVRPTDDKKTGTPVVKKKYIGASTSYISQRFSDLVKAVSRQEWHKASEYVLPTFVEEKGKENIRWPLSGLFPYAPALQDPKNRIKADVMMDKEKEGKEANVFPKLWVFNRWVDVKGCRWVEVDGDWYVDPQQEAVKPEGSSSSVAGSSGFTPMGEKPIKLEGPPRHKWGPGGKPFKSMGD